MFRLPNSSPIPGCIIPPPPLPIPPAIRLTASHDYEEAEKFLKDLLDKGWTPAGTVFKTINFGICTWFDMLPPQTNDYQI